MLSMDGDLRQAPAETRSTDVAEKSFGPLPKPTEDVDDTRRSVPPIQFSNLRHWLWCVFAASGIGYVFSYVVSSSDPVMRSILFIAVSVGLVFVFCGLAEFFDRMRG